jgi:hypothetical protein
MQSPFPSMDPFVERDPLFHELHLLMVTTAQVRFQPQLRPGYIARLERLDELHLWKQRRIVIYTLAHPRLAVASIAFLTPSNKDAGSVCHGLYLEKRSSALHQGLHWIEIDLLRGGQRPPMPVAVPPGTDYLAYIAQATPEGWRHLLYSWKASEPFPLLPIPLMGSDQATLDLGACFGEAYDRSAADLEVNYTAAPSPALSPDNSAWVDQLLRQKGLRQ